MELSAGAVTCECGKGAPQSVTRCEGDTTNEILLTGRAGVELTHLFLGAPTSEARVVKFCTQGDRIKSCQTDVKSPQKRHGTLGSRDPFLHA